MRDSNNKCEVNSNIKNDGSDPVVEVVFSKLKNYVLDLSPWATTNNNNVVVRTGQLDQLVCARNFWTKRSASHETISSSKASQFGQNLQLSVQQNWYLLFADKLIRPFSFDKWWSLFFFFVRKWFEPRSKMQWLKEDHLLLATDISTTAAEAIFKVNLCRGHLQSQDTEDGFRTGWWNIKHQ